MPLSSLSKPAPRVEQARDVAGDVDDALRRPDDPGEHLEERALAGAVGADDRERFAVEQAQRDVAQRPELLVPAARRTSGRWIGGSSSCA